MSGMLLVLLVSCGKPTGDADCSESVACALGSVCVEGVCQAQTCATSEQCAIGQFCGSGQSCQPGCEQDTDCRYGEFCSGETQSCEPAECSDTNIDCGFQEFCSPAGECYQASGYYCRECQEAGDCGGSGNLCYGGYCAVSCTSRADCPSGFDCLGFTDSLTGNIIGYGCYAACWLYE